MAAFDVLLHILHKVTVHVNENPALRAFQMKMVGAFFALIKAICGCFPVCEAGQYSLICELGEGSVNRCLTRVDLTSFDYILRGEAFAAMLVEKLDYLVALLGVIAVSVHLIHNLSEKTILKLIVITIFKLYHKILKNQEIHLIFF